MSQLSGNCCRMRALPKTPTSTVRTLWCGGRGTVLYTHVFACCCCRFFFYYYYFLLLPCIIIILLYASKCGFYVFVYGKIREMAFTHFPDWLALGAKGYNYEVYTPFAIEG